jgi:uncharacterized protein
MTNFFDVLLIAGGLMLVMEGLLPFIAPERWKEVFRKASELPVQQVRIMGFASILIGLILLWTFGS